MSDFLPPPEKIPGRGVAQMILARELRWLYVLLVVFLFFLGVALMVLGGYNLRGLVRGNPDEVSVTGALLYLSGGILALIIALGLRQTRRYFVHIQELTRERIKQVEFSKIDEGDFAKVDQIIQIREEKARSDFERNLGDAFLISSLEISGVDFFDRCSWKLKPGVNILLGRNGYGKSLLLHCLAALLQKDDEASKPLFESASSRAFMELTVERNSAPEIIRRERERFTNAMGKIPILAIPDSRFVNRTETSIKGQKGDELSLRVDGARHFLEDRPYGEVMQVLFTELCFDYLEKRSFNHPSFKLLQDAVKTLTGEEFQFHAVERVGRDAFRLLVVTEGNERPLPIQFASQGTLSVLGVLGLIRSYLKGLFPAAREEEFLEKPAIVFVDELDAHLHPLWQQKLNGILRDNFPNVQFVLSAHSPLVVAGCWSGEVSVLRKGSGGFQLQQIDHDFVGTPIEEIYKIIFGVEDFDENYLKSASRAQAGFSNAKRISELEKKENATELERRELLRLIREEGMIRRAAEVKAERKDDRQRVEELEAKIEALTDELESFRERNGNS
jgi:predicted ATP-binding protein involved in virulence